jgi:hypothetical protein
MMKIARSLAFPAKRTESPPQQKKEHEEEKGMRKQREAEDPKKLDDTHKSFPRRPQESENHSRTTN